VLISGISTACLVSLHTFNTTCRRAGVQPATTTQNKWGDRERDLEAFVSNERQRRLIEEDLDDPSQIEIDPKGDYQALAINS
jgi:hypothetical protein